MHCFLPRAWGVQGDGTTPRRRVLPAVPGAYTGEEKVSPFKNILISYFWTIVSTTTLKQADLTVSSAASRVIAVGLAYCQLIMVALPLAVVGRHFMKQYNLLMPADASDEAFFAHDHPDSVDGSDKV